MKRLAGSTVFLLLAACSPSSTPPQANAPANGTTPASTAPAASPPPAQAALADVAESDPRYVIGISYSVEYAIKGLYENTIGRVFEWIRGENRTPQDEYARAVLSSVAGKTSSWSSGTDRE